MAVQGPSWQDVYRRVDRQRGHAEEGSPFPKYLEPEGSSLIAPFIPTEVHHVREGLLTAQCGPGDRVLDLGCGDGRFCVCAVQEVRSPPGSPWSPVPLWSRTGPSFCASFLSIGPYPVPHSHKPLKHYKLQTIVPSCCQPRSPTVPPSASRSCRPGSPPDVRHGFPNRVAARAQVASSLPPARGFKLKSLLQFLSTLTDSCPVEVWSGKWNPGGEGFNSFSLSISVRPPFFSRPILR